MDAHALAVLGVRQVVQVSAVLATAGVVERVFLKGKARAAYVLWLVVLMKCLVPPVWSSPLGVFSWVSGHAVIGAGSAEGVVGASGAEGWGWEEVLAGVWLAGATGMLCGIAGRAMWLRWRVLRESAEAPAEVRAWAKGVRLVVCEGRWGRRWWGCCGRWWCCRGRWWRTAGRSSCERWWGTR
jgi:hypothetical protein